MQLLRPLPDTNPEFCILQCPGYREYRVENWHLARDGSGRVVRGTSGWSWKEAIFPAIVSLAWPKVREYTLIIVGLAILTLFMMYTKCTQILHESVIVLPEHGIQLETHRGFPPWPLAVSRLFIPTSELLDFIINEGLRRWDVRYYLAAMKKTDTPGFALEVAYENILPHFPVLLEVYQGVQETLFPANSNIHERSAV
ncbi:hypothetical protein PLICRDRAFT_41813 [Plicaturopsis crispa FD-325 SS-3]|nr:hypothetical protein PLICRDRAFT_41813 [Plicaturopsis crispa FD-325 SS-3]